MVLCYITASSKEEARNLGRMLVEKRLAACVNIVDAVESMYWWEGKIETSQEALLIAKTEERLVDLLTAAIKAMHSYSVPCVLTLPIGNGNPEYLKWLEENLR